ncbi:hypothetical protein VQ056_21695 [Paenibacillus sp. JTLBN-2024]
MSMPGMPFALCAAACLLVQHPVQRGLTFVVQLLQLASTSTVSEASFIEEDNGFIFQQSQA